MQMTELFLGELEREAKGTRRALERVPDNRNEWQPHVKSMTLGRLANLVAGMPGWVAMMVNQDSLDVAPVGGNPNAPTELRTSRELLALHDRNVGTARAALAATTDAHLMTTWKMLAAGHVVSEKPRHIMLRDGCFNHLAHHRGQLTVYLRLLDAPVPAIYGPSADDARMD